MIREFRVKDIARLRELGFDRECGDDFLTGVVATDASDQPVMFAGAWHRAEVHMALDHSWGTPALRLALLDEVHAAMERELSKRQVGQVVTWLDNMRAFGRRLTRLGWVKSELTSWHRLVRGIR